MRRSTSGKSLPTAARSELRGLIRNSGAIRADGVVLGEHGEILLKATGNTTLEAGSVVSANGAQGGNVTIQSGDTTLVSGVVEAKGSEGQGGSVQLLGNRVGVIDAAIVDASGQTGGRYGIGGWRLPGSQS